MTPKPVRLSPAARRDASKIALRYRAEAGEGVALDFAQALERALDHIGHDPASGAPRYGDALTLPGLQFWPVRPFPHLVFYVEMPDRVRVWRIVHGSRDIPRVLRS